MFRMIQDAGKTPAAVRPGNDCFLTAAHFAGLGYIDNSKG